MKDGKRLTVYLSLPTEHVENRSAAVELQSMWRAIGIETVLRPSPVNTLLGPDGMYARGDYEIGINSEGFATSPNRNNDIITSAIPPRGLNYSRYSNAEVDRLVVEGEITLDPAKRKSIFHAIAQRLAADVPLRPYCWRTAPYVVIKRFGELQARAREFRPMERVRMEARALAARQRDVTGPGTEDDRRDRDADRDRVAERRVHAVAEDLLVVRHARARSRGRSASTNALNAST